MREALNEIEHWCKILRRQGVQPFMHGFAEAGFFDLASFSDIAFATGQALGPCQPAPPRARRASSKPDSVCIMNVSPISPGIAPRAPATPPPQTCQAQRMQAPARRQLGRLRLRRKSCSCDLNLPSSSTPRPNASCRPSPIQSVNRCCGASRPKTSSPFHAASMLTWPRCCVRDASDEHAGRCFFSPATARLTSIHHRLRIRPRP